MPSSSPRSSSLLRDSILQVARFYWRATSHGRTPHPVVIIDLAWNAGILTAGILAIAMRVDEWPAPALKVWMCLYALKCGLYIAKLLLEYRERRQPGWRAPEEGPSTDEEEAHVTFNRLTGDGSSISTSISDAVPYLVPVCAILRCVWWSLGYYWVSHAGRQFIELSPLLYWLCVVILAYDMSVYAFTGVWHFALGCALVK